MQVVLPQASPAHVEPEVEDDDGYSKTGWIVKKSKRGKKWKQLYFCVRRSKKLLYYFESQHAVKPKGIVDLETCALHLVDDSLFGR